MGLSLTVLGCSGSYPGAGRACSGYLVRSDTTTIWLDAGSGTLANLQRHVELAAVDAVVLSHEHPDHWVDITGYYVACKHYLNRASVPVYAPAGVREAVYYRDEPLEWHTVTDRDQRRIGDLALTFSRTDHGNETLAVRVDAGGRSLGYSADSGPGWSLEALGPGLDLALCEATYLEDMEGRGQHMSARQAGVTGRAAGARRLVLTHLQPGTDPEASRAEATNAFGSAVEVAEEHAVYEL
ncbi:MAG: MBL fold metallo-hydrolase [Actinobacteria bacterium]|nr:MBL fold metallo-hydrolase [Actinomycetota bacterium]